MNNPKPLAAVDLTHVQFDPEDPLGMPMAYASLVPIALLVSYATLILFRRDLATITMLTGQLLNEAVNYVAKKAFRQARPTEYLGRGYGMPSSHAQFVAFFAVYTIVYTYRRLSFNHNHWKHLIGVASLANAALVAYSRVRLHYHTPKQVWVGLGCGTVFALIWFVVVDQIVVPLMHSQGVLDRRLSRWLYIRDTRHIPNIVEFEWKSVNAAGGGVGVKRRSGRVANKTN